MQDSTPTKKNTKAEISASPTASPPELTTPEALPDMGGFFYEAFSSLHF